LGIFVLRNPVAHALLRAASTLMSTLGCHSWLRAGLPFTACHR